MQLAQCLRLVQAALVDLLHTLLREVERRWGRWRWRTWRQKEDREEVEVAVAVEVEVVEEGAP
tara:strand:- start:538 stop:726 length:189 start_codon:yes stop_codon:yes gene_type:complete